MVDDTPTNFRFYKQGDTDYNFRSNRSVGTTSIIADASSYLLIHQHTVLVDWFSNKTGGWMALVKLELSDALPDSVLTARDGDSYVMSYLRGCLLPQVRVTVRSGTVG